MFSLPEHPIFALQWRVMLFFFYSLISPSMSGQAFCLSTILFWLLRYGLNLLLMNIYIGLWFQCCCILINILEVIPHINNLSSDYESIRKQPEYLQWIKYSEHKVSINSNISNYLFLFHLSVAILWPIHPLRWTRHLRT